MRREEELDEEEVDERTEDEEDDNYLEYIASLIQQQDRENNLFYEPDPDLNPEVDVDYDVDNDLEEAAQTIDYDQFDDVYELFRIHTSNAEIIRNTDAIDGQAWYPNASTNGVSCPVCGLEMSHANELGSHFVYYHSRLFVSLAGTMYPNFNINDIENVYSRLQPPSLYRTALQSYNYPQLPDRESNMREFVYRLMYNDDSEYQPSYEELLGLCEYIGYHKEGIVDIEGTTTKTIANEEENIKPDDACSICLETLLSKEFIRKINACGHVFCSECIETWFKENKTCPLCKMELEKDDECKSCNRTLDRIDV